MLVGSVRGEVSSRRAPWSGIACATLLSVAAVGVAPAGAAAPRPVSPGSRSEGSLTELRCPTFSWAGVPGAEGYELAVFRLQEGPDAEPVLVTRSSVAGDARAWTPAVGQCLERGQRYAWSVAAVDRERAGRRTRTKAPGQATASTDATTGDDSVADLAWSEALLFEVEAAPSAGEVEQALATLQRHLDAQADASGRGTDEAGRLGSGTASATSPLAVPSTTPPPGRGVRPEGEPAARAELGSDPVRRSRPSPPAVRPDLDPALRRQRIPIPEPAAVRVEQSVGYAPDLGDASLTVSDQIHLAAASDFFKEGVVFLWDDAQSNLALGREALANANDFDARANTAVGTRALRSNTSGARNTAVGAFSLTTNQSGGYNTAVGSSALYSNTSGNYNTAAGWVALAGNSTGFRNTGIGAYALRSNSSGYRNTVTGWESMFYNSTGHDNTAAGARALYKNTTGAFNTGTGAFALRSNTSGATNTATGSEALFSNTTGSNNTATGAQALNKNTDGGSNTASGAQALYSNTSGVGNTAHGFRALRANTTGLRNIASGFDALRSNTTGSSNTANGYRALYGNTTGAKNTSLGYEALQTSSTSNFNTAIGGLALFGSTGANNTALGYRAGINNSTGGYSIFIANDGSNSDSATIKIGTQGTQTTTFIAGISGVNVSGAGVVVNAAGQLGVVLSSRELKRDVQDLGALGDRLLELHPVAFRYRQHVEADPDSRLEFGLLAEEVAEVFPELVIFDQAGRPQTVKYHLLSALLLGELQRQHAALEQQRDEHRRELARHRAEQERLAARVEALEERPAPREPDLEPARRRR